MNTINQPKDKGYFKALSKEHPHLQVFLAEVGSRYAVSIDSRIECDSTKHLGQLCARRLFPEEISVFVTPAPDYKPLVLCRDCLRREYAKVASSGEYDVHLRHLEKDHPARKES